MAEWSQSELGWHKAAPFHSIATQAIRSDDDGHGRRGRKRAAAMMHIISCPMIPVEGRFCRAARPARVAAPELPAQGPRSTAIGRRSS